MEHKLLMMQSKPTQKPQHRKWQRTEHKLLMTWSKHVGKQLEISRKKIVVDTIDFGFTIMDPVQNKGYDAAKDLREKAKEIEDVFIQ